MYVRLRVYSKSLWLYVIRIFPQGSRPPSATSEDSGVLLWEDGHPITVIFLQLNPAYSVDEAAEGERWY